MRNCGCRYSKTGFQVSCCFQCAAVATARLAQTQDATSEDRSDTETCPRCDSSHIGLCQDYSQQGELENEWQECGECGYEWSWAVKPDTGEQERPDVVLMPRELTAENGAKAALSGEFTQRVPNPLHCQCGEADCEMCEAAHENTETMEVMISWTTIKRIYRAAVKVMAIPASGEQ